MSSSVAGPGPNPPYVIRTPRLLVRCLEPGDAQHRKEAIDSSSEHLRDFFVRTSEEPPSLEFHASQIRKCRGKFDLDEDRIHGVFEPDTGRFLGEVTLLKRAGIHALEIGYWLRADAVGKGLATEMASAAVKVAFEVDGVKRVDLMCAPANERSAAVARRLGFSYEGRLRDRQLAPHHPRGDLLSFSMLAAEYPQSLAYRLELEAFDFMGRRLL